MGALPCYLSEHAYFCLADEHYVFLDLRKDAYLCLGRAQTDALKEVLGPIWGANGRSPRTQFPDIRDPDRSSVLETLLQEQLLVRKPASGKIPSPSYIEIPSTSLMANSSKPKAGRIGPTVVLRFLTAATRASIDLRWYSIEHTVRTVEDRKRAGAASSGPRDGAEVSELFWTFQTLRPYYPRPYLCLFDSLALLHFLAQFSVFPEWVYGVKLEPFGAHCWVQVEDLLVNDIVDTVRPYTPIMSI